jgi:hypothetical protein
MLWSNPAKRLTHRLNRKKNRQFGVHSEASSVSESTNASNPTSPVGCFIVAFFRLIARLNPRKTSLRVA